MAACALESFSKLHMPTASINSIAEKSFNSKNLIKQVHIYQLLPASPGNLLECGDNDKQT
jgi:hypothetical protein